MITFTYSENSEAIAKSLEGFAEALADQQPALREIADDFREVAARQFATEGRAEGAPWAGRKSSSVGAAPRGRPTGAAASSPSRITEGRRRGLPLLVRTGALRDSLSRKGSAGHVEEFYGQALAIGSRLPYAGFHHFGTRRMPARPMIVLSDTRAARWKEFVRRAIEEKTPLLGKAQLT